uniref:Uncharacterized protein n=1 Tax=Chromera velia CCMP2878 TaxID=1169474 RepID=A0A0G4G2T5_9ALVE|eukprot:Cvel_4092.t1-p1 / transcript=Cvel_4092.t1 / gene=Cvel_4092 / organism=Chromera_velia_CCMP2878 / gene_product=Putative ankyrin repeat protein MM_0045, putative / transcript_product=Putative ankyrin repeat protein MM_0045, putative / location=Cvel_scaffold174:54891-56885(-) / protein_length=665 / sequence_SO=supercontig / SO=protein_coding / is_pseudo=false
MLVKERARVNEQIKSNGATALMFAARNGHPEVVGVLLREKALVNAKTSGGETPLFYAASGGHVEVVDALIEGKAEVNEKNNTNSTALIQAAQNGHPEVVALLLKAKAEVNVQTEDGSTALMYAAGYGQADVVGMLLRNNAEVNLQAKDGSTALMKATSNHHKGVVALLLRNGADPTIESPVFGTAAALAEKQKRPKLQSLLEGNAPDLLAHPVVDWMESQTASWTPIAELIREGAVMLWPLSVLRLLAQKQRPVPRRQDVPAELRDLGMEEHKIQAALEGAAKFAAAENTEIPLLGRFSLVCISYGWLSRAHPDPNSFHLQLLVKGIDRQWWAKGQRGERVFVFWDFMSLFQLPRDEQQEALFRKALKNLDLLYSSSHTRVYRSTGVPPNSPNALPYDKRGWPTFETSVTGFKPSRLLHQLPTTLQKDSECRGGKKAQGDKGPGRGHEAVLPPRAPADFNSLVDTKTFTNGADTETVKTLYEQFVHRTACSVQRVSFSSRALFSDDDAASLCGLFKYLLTMQPGQEGGSSEVAQWEGTEQIDLSRTGVTDKGAVMVIETLKEVKSLRSLDFTQTKVTMETVKALEVALRRLPNLASLGRVSFSGCRLGLNDSQKIFIQKLASSVEFRRKRLTLDLRDGAAESISRVGMHALQHNLKQCPQFELIL